MHPLIAAAIGALVGMLIVGIPFAICWRLRERTFENLRAAYERIITRGDERLEAADATFLAYRNREYAEHNLPPEGTDMLQEHVEKRQEAARRAQERRDNPRPSRIGAVDQSQLAMDQAVFARQR